MKTRSRLCIGVVCFLAIGLSSPGVLRAQDEKRPSLAAQQKSLAGVWEISEESNYAVPKLEIALQGDQLGIQFFLQTQSGQGKFGSAETLHLLSPFDGDESVPKDTILAFTTLSADDATMHFALTVLDGKMNVDAIKIASDGSQKLNRVISAGYAKSGNSSTTADVSSDDKLASVDEESDDAENGSETGVIKGRVDTGSTLRGTFTLSPAPDNIEPGANIEVGGPRPAFAFSKLPKGEYSLTFKGTADGVSKTRVWGDLEIAAAGDEPLILSLRSGE
ncbi:hypothetical protein Q31b_20170 [Novipirellula aureliae]|uniref:Uncharacterized protein n=1 Tax=Novipirellula aureliae TaxID=2527966 RepID=A0A5C6DZX0_9BACT|nr:hypothetical protein [Novipirellula aureliae]TWU42983.1 hypothetical protein Q31b_20170 [Novipirellula aureliae]